MKTLRERIKTGIPENEFEKDLERELLSYGRELSEILNYGPNYNIVTKTAAYTAKANDTVILCDATDAAFTVTLPTADGCKSKVYHIKKIDSGGNAVTVDGAGSEKIDGATTKALSNQFNCIFIISDGSNWQIIGNV